MHKKLDTRFSAVAIGGNEAIATRSLGETTSGVGFPGTAVTQPMSPLRASSDPYNLVVGSAVLTALVIKG